MKSASRGWHGEGTWDPLTVTALGPNVVSTPHFLSAGWCLGLDPGTEKGKAGKIHVKAGVRWGMCQRWSPSHDKCTTVTLDNLGNGVRVDGISVLVLAMQLVSNSKVILRKSFFWFLFC